MTQPSGKHWQGRTLVAGTATGAALILSEPLSFWGGMDVATGRIIDQHHPQVGALLSGRVLIMPAGRGSSSSSSVLAEAIYAGTAPAAIILTESDVIVAVGAMVAAELYGKQCPVVVVIAPLPVETGRPLLVKALPTTTTITLL
jgi:uncharacterized protein